MTVREVVGGVLLAAGVLWLLVTVLATADVLSRGPVDLRALVGMLAVGGLAVTWGWLLSHAGSAPIMIARSGSTGSRRRPLQLAEALSLLASHVCHIQAGQRDGANPLALELVDADMNRVIGQAGLCRRVDDRGDDWVELGGSPIMWLGHHAEREISTVRP